MEPTLYYRPDDHSYWIDEARIWGVSEILWHGGMLPFEFVDQNAPAVVRGTVLHLMVNAFEIAAT